MAIDMNTSTNEYDPWLTPDEMAKEVPLHRDTIISRIKSGELPGIHPGKRYFVRKSAFEAWMQAHLTNKSRSSGLRSEKENHDDVS